MSTPHLFTPRLHFRRCHAAMLSSIQKVCTYLRCHGANAEQCQANQQIVVEQVSSLLETIIYKACRTAITDSNAVTDGKVLPAMAVLHALCIIVSSKVQNCLDQDDTFQVC